MNEAAALAAAPAPTAGEALEKIIIHGDLGRLTPAERTAYYVRVCDALGLRPETQPFALLTLNGKMILYPKRECTEQLRKRDRVSIEIVARELVCEDLYVVTARAKTPAAKGQAGRTDESIGAVCLTGLKNEARANAVMKAETKAKRRVTLSICGLGMLDESEVDSIPGAWVVDAQVVDPGPPALPPPAAANGEPKPAPHDVRKFDPQPAPAARPEDAPADSTRLDRVDALVQALNLSPAKVAERLRDLGYAEDWHALTMGQAADVIDRLEKAQAARKAGAAAAAPAKS